MRINPYPKPNNTLGFHLDANRSLVDGVAERLAGREKEIHCHNLWGIRP